MIRWISNGGDLRGYLGGVQDHSFVIGVSSSPAAESVLITLLPGMHQTDFHVDLKFLMAKADSILRHWMTITRLHCRSCDTHACEE